MLSCYVFGKGAQRGWTMGSANRGVIIHVVDEEEQARTGQPQRGMGCVCPWTRATTQGAGLQTRGEGKRTVIHVHPVLGTSTLCPSTPSTPPHRPP